jgi:hypothetical protein
MPWPGGPPTSSAASTPTSRCCCDGLSKTRVGCLNKRRLCPGEADLPSVAADRGRLLPQPAHRRGPPTQPCDAAASTCVRASRSQRIRLLRWTTTGRVVRWPPDACFRGRCRSVCRRAVSAANAAGQTFACAPLLRLHECTTGTSGRLERQMPRKHGALANSGTGTRTPISRTRTGRHCQLDYPGQCFGRQDSQRPRSRLDLCGTARHPSGGGTNICSYMTRDRVLRMLAEGMSQAEIARSLRITKSAVAYHVRRVREPDPRFRRRYDWRLVQAYYDGGRSVDECVAHFGFSKGTWHEAKNRGAIATRPNCMPIEELLSRPRDRQHLKRRLVKAGLLHPRCRACGIAEWRGRPLSLELHHINGDGQDNRLENLELLCPNCHSQTDSWGGRNSQARRRRVA